ncbi:MAG: hypothetical protein R3E89_09955 [Thiolinea sp.]
MAIEKKLLKYTGLVFKDLEIFTHCLDINDSEGNYLEQGEATIRVTSIACWKPREKLVGFVGCNGKR